MRGREVAVLFTLSLCCGVLVAVGAFQDALVIFALMSINLIIMSR